MYTGKEKKKNERNCHFSQYTSYSYSFLFDIDTLVFGIFVQQVRKKKESIMTNHSFFFLLLLYPLETFSYMKSYVKQTNRVPLDKFVY